MSAERETNANATLILVRENSELSTAITPTKAAIPKPTATNLVTSKEVAPDRNSPSEHEAQFVVGKTIPSAGGCSLRGSSEQPRARLMHHPGRQRRMEIVNGPLYRDEATLADVGIVGK